MVEGSLFNILYFSSHKLCKNSLLHLNPSFIIQVDSNNQESKPNFFILSVAARRHLGQLFQATKFCVLNTLMQQNCLKYLFGRLRSSS